MGAGRPPTQVHRDACYLVGKRHRPLGREVASAAAALPAPTAARVTSIRAGRRQCPAVVRLRGCRMRRLLERLPPWQPLRLRHPSSSPSQLREQLIERCRPRQLPQSATPAHTGPTPRRTARNRNAPERSTAAGRSASIATAVARRTDKRTRSGRSACWVLRFDDPVDLHGAWRRRRSVADGAHTVRSSTAARLYLRVAPELVRSH
ncbi:hypothetical protein [Streptomyces sp. NPDC127105]|uniref:hypothetical protein n=1 Tax=Streptomyces sp. NPDC127105 TaxID=3345359 RepID=UPI00365741EB